MPEDPARSRRQRRTRKATEKTSTITSSNTLVASAALLTPGRKALRPTEDWQDELWGFYDETPELRFGTGWLGSALSRVRLFAGVWDPDGDEPVHIDLDGEGDKAPTPVERAAVDVLAQLCEGRTGQAQMMAEFGVHLTLPGLAYLVGIPAVVGDRDEWMVLSSDELSTKAKPSAENGYVWVRRTGDEEKDKEELPDGTLVVKVWRGHKRHHWKPDSPARAQLPVLRELSLLTQHVEASAQSRLAGAGILLLPQEITFPVSPENANADDPFLAEFIKVTVTPIKDRSSASAVVPYPLRVPGEWVDKIKHLSFATPLDDKAIALREEAIRRFATGMDMPAEVLLGMTDANHWSAWQVEESAIKMHVEPTAETAVQGLTIGYLFPALAALGFTPEQYANIVVWYDATDLASQPNRAQDAKDVFDRKGIGLAALRRETGFSDDDAPSEEELRTQLLLDVLASAPTLFPQVAPMLGITDTTPADAPPLDDGAAPPTGGTPPPAEPTGGVPDTQGDPAPVVGQASLAAAADVLVTRALERAGNRLLNGMRRKPPTGFDLNVLGDVALTEMHTAVPDPTTIAPLDSLLADAWTTVPNMVQRWGVTDVDPDVLVDALDNYVRGLIAGGQVHTWERLLAVVGEGP